ncbi:MAG: ribose 5-phosphate isomerase B [Flavobacteriales bacterium]|nr:ribose 5-phosphate isomerase B [Flavobacteriales bacterium]
MKIALASDHAGFELKQKIKQYLKDKNIEIVDFGTNSEDSVDYPDHIHPAATAVENKEVDFGIILCGSGQGAAMTANKHQGIRAALCWTEELAHVTRLHNDSNILTIPARFIEEKIAYDMIDTFLSTEFEGGRHQGRINKISCS